MPPDINHLLPQDRAMTTFESMHQDDIVGKLTTVDRLIFNGYFMSFFWPGYFKRFLCRQDILLKDFGRYVQKATDAVKQNARRMADSGVTRSPIPRQGDHRFRRKAIADSGHSDH